MHSNRTKDLWGGEDAENGQLLLGKSGQPLNSDDELDEDKYGKYGGTQEDLWLLRHLREPMPPRSLRMLVGFCSISVMVLISFSFYLWSQHLPLLKTMPSYPAEDTTSEDGSISSAAPVAVSQIPPSDFFDLKKTDFSSGASGSTGPSRRVYFFNITRGTGSPDGVDKPMLLVNGQSPGPLIEANTGDAVRVIVHNGMAANDSSTTIHWHGIDQRDTSWMDGVHGVTQCGIPPGESFTYEFTVSEQRGTFWYHSHTTGQYTDGLFGPLIIHDPDERIPEVDEDRIIMVADLYHQPEKELLNEYFGVSAERRRHSAPVGMEPAPDNVVMNGRNIFDCDINSERQVHHLSDGEYTLMQCKSGSIYSTRVRHGQRMRLRLISHSSNIPIWFSVDSHVLQIVEIDGVEVEPISTTRVFVNPGQRYSVILTADADSGNYAMRAAAVRSCSMIRPGNHLDSVNNEATGILSYDDTDPASPLLGEPWDLSSQSHPDFGAEPWASRTCEDMPFDLAKPVRSVDVFYASDQNTYDIPFEMKHSGKSLLTFVGGTVFSTDPDDAILWKAANSNDASPNTTNVVFPNWHFPENQHVFVSRDDGGGAQIALSAINMMTHPWHLHGQTFQIVGWGSGAYGTGTTTWNHNNPLRRDTITLAGGTHVVLRIHGDNPGIWPLHCHIQWHAEGGMFALVGQRLDVLEKQVGALDNSIPHQFCKSSSW